MFATESPAFYEALAAEREALPALPVPTAPLKRGKYVRCSRCKATGSARYNHRNGDTYCYLCSGTGWQVRLSQAEKDAEEAEREWYGTAHYNGYQFGLTVRKLSRKAAEAKQGFVYHRIDNPEPSDPDAIKAWVERSRRTMTFWTDALEDMHTEYTS